MLNGDSGWWGMLSWRDLTIGGKDTDRNFTDLQFPAPNQWALQASTGVNVSGTYVTKGKGFIPSFDAPSRENMRLMIEDWVQGLADFAGPSVSQTLCDGRSHFRS